MFPTQNRAPSGGAAMPPAPPKPAGASAGGAGGPPPSGGRRPVRVPPQMQQHIDPNNPVQQELLQRIDQLSPQDIKAFATGISPAAVAVLKKVLPELGFLLNRLGAGPSVAPGGPGGAGPSPAPALPPGGGPVNGAPPPAPPPMPTAGPSAMPRPQTKLADF